MHVDRVTVRWAIVLLVIAGLAWVEAALHGNHYYRLAYEACGSGFANLYCAGWRDVAIFRTIMILAAGAALLTYNERRSVP
ncbi:MAG TPA: hypothetical protein VIN40_03835 [Candidatus Tyrphobacter sp.]